MKVCVFGKFLNALKPHAILCTVSSICAFLAMNKCDSSKRSVEMIFVSSYVTYASISPHLTQDVQVGGHAEDHGQLVHQLHLVLERPVEQGRAHAYRQQAQIAHG